MKKKLLIGCGSTILAVIAIIAGLCLWLWAFSRPNAIEMTDYHPFRSRQAKAECLQRYDEAAKNWPIVSETMFVDTS